MRFGMGIAAIVGVALASSCSAPGSIEDGDAAVAAFHRKYDSGDYARIWSEGSPVMQSATDQQGLTRLLEMVRGKMGKVVDTRREGWRSNFNTAGSTIELVMSTRFEHGSGKEDFVFASGGATLKLSGYHISSPDLIEEQPTASPRSPGRRRPGLPRG